ncbi:MAG: glycosyltransferase [Prevotella sp.]|nr:glycosyltransferase [Prevotella sp.]
MISVIMPIYNGEKFIDNSISNILKEKDVEIELILVNDGSNDNSLAICEKYASLDDRIRIVNKPNGGICSARNAGMKAAKGDYISFCDQDDEIVNGAYSVFAKASHAKSFDLVIAGKRLKQIDNEGKIINDRVYRYGDKAIGDKEIIDLILNIDRNISLLHIWNCLYRRDIIEKYSIRFDETFRFGMEDTMFNIEYGVYCKDAILANDIVYDYSRRLNVSTSTKYNEHFLEDYSYFVNKMFTSFDKVYGSKYKSDVFLYCIRLGIKSFYYLKDNKIDCANGSIWEKIYSVLIPYKTKRLFHKKYNPYFWMLWLVWLLSDYKCYNIVAALLRIVRPK